MRRLANMVTDDERREVARMLRELPGDSTYPDLIGVIADHDGWYPASDAADRLADLIEPSYKPDAKYEAWYNNLSHFGDKRGEPSTIRELIEEIVWAALTVDLGPNGNTDPSTGIDEGDVYTHKQFTEWEREALHLSGGCDRDALLALADELGREADWRAEKYGRFYGSERLWSAARRIREACGMVDAG